MYKKVGEYQINDKELDIPIGQQEIKIVPVAVGSKGFGKFLFGAVLIGVLLWNPAVGMGLLEDLGFGTAAGATATFGTSLLAAAGNIGIYLALSVQPRC